jgi:UDP-N-acetylmuramoyl-L-alanyl-D-glutamate--2,6-diaminopimelate ligase
MGKIAAEYCDQIILTDEDPYDENPDSILDQIESGFSQIPSLREVSRSETNSYSRILNRKDAIKKALESARPGDVVIITGKGAEPWMMTKNGKISWDDREIVKEEISASRSRP